VWCGVDVSGSDVERDRLTRLRNELEAAPDRKALSDVLDALAAEAKTSSGALALLLEQIIERQLAEVSVRSMFFDDASVDDAVQETVIAVANGIGGFRGEARFLTWLDRVARNSAGQLRRRRVPEPVADIGETMSWAGRLSSVVANEQLVAQALDQLTDGYRQMIYLREIEDLSYDQIAERLQLPLNTVRTRLRRARAQLVEVLLRIQVAQ